MLSFARILILDPALPQLVPNTQHLDCVSIWFHMELFEELCNQNEASLFRVSFPEGFNGVRKTAWRALSFSFPPRIIPHSQECTENNEKPTNFLCGKCTPSNCMEKACVSSSLDLLEYNQSVPESLVNNINSHYSSRFLVLPS